MAPAIELNGITKTFFERSWSALLTGRKRRRTEALKEVSLSIPRGEIFGLLGPNGAGKTTLIKLLATLILPDGGRASICGHDLYRESDQVRRVIGLVTTGERSFYWRLTGRQNLHFYAALYDLRGKKRKRRVEELLELVGLEEKADTMFMKYSDGQKQRLAIARALLPDPQVLLMDEPTKSVDPIGAADLISLTVQELAGRRGKTVLWSTHNLKEAEALCSRLAIIHHGALIAVGNLAYMRSLIDSESRYQLTVDDYPADLFRALGVTPLSVTRSNGCHEVEFRAQEQEIPNMVRLLVSRGIEVRACKSKNVELEEVFEKLVNHGPERNRKTVVLPQA